ncbi:MAG: 16S rRNA (cytidine(1402)-2'-O)-methyltransferase [Flavobacteriales bacterium]|nr:16S rRNA (cytidine(1402)-2'-O)-methyltransferase [Flavobacteriales bacterium]
MSGILTLVPTPIGNLDDITFRAVQVLKTVDLILCEDTRHSGKLLQHIGVENKLSPFHQHNEHKVTERLVDQLIGGTNMALVTDAGTPGISDPGYLLVRACIERDIRVEVLPGATAIIPAIVGSGLPCEKYLYLGFPPQKKGRQTFWRELTDTEHTMVMYESPHRIQKALREAAEVFGNERRACVVRELSKVYESYHRGTLEELHALGEAQAYKGEIVLVIEGTHHAEKRKKG